jgi:predicted metal-binding membrane protein
MWYSPPPTMIPTLEAALRRDRILAVVGLALTTVLAWLDLAWRGAGITSVARDTQVARGAMDMSAWGLVEWFSLFTMWAVMMIGMMLPSVAPTLLHMLQLFRRRGDRFAHGSAFAFVGGHLLPWMLFSALAATAQLFLHRAALLGAEMSSQSMVLTGTLLLTVGVYQCLPVKTACLTYCRPPRRFLEMERRDGTFGALRMGVDHGVFCVGCCVALMALLFVFGVMNLLWAAAITVLLFIEKIAPARARVEYLSGIPLIVWGAAELARS